MMGRGMNLRWRESTLKGSWSSSFALPILLYRAFSFQWLDVPFFSFLCEWLSWYHIAILQDAWNLRVLLHSVYCRLLIVDLFWFILYLLFSFGFAACCLLFCNCSDSPCIFVALRAQATKYLFAHTLFGFTCFVMYWHFVDWDVRTPSQSLFIAVLQSCRWS